MRRNSNGNSLATLTTSERSFVGFDTLTRTGEAFDCNLVFLSVKILTPSIHLVVYEFAHLNPTPDL